MIFKILRSIITSFLFTILIILLIINTIITTIRINNHRISDLISRENIYDNIIENNVEITKDIGIKYIDEYINYVFYKRSYPSFNTIEIENKNEYEKRIISENINIIKSKLNIEYENIIKIRKINNFLSNSSIYLLLNISIILVLLLMVITNKEFNKTFQLFGYTLIISATFSLILSSIIYNSLKDNNNQLISVISSNILNPSITKNFFNINIIYISIGFILIISTYLINKMIQK